MGYLQACNGRICDGTRPVCLRGVNFGGWLMMEGYILHAPNRAVQLFKKDFAKRLGPQALTAFERAFEEYFIQAEDVRRVRAMGLNCIRLPFHYGVVEEAPGKINRKGIARIDGALRWAREAGVRVILDMHAAPGAQNADWHADAVGRARFWGSPAYQRRAVRIWEFLADRYKDHPEVAGYDLLNEAVTEDTRALNAYYHEVIRHIRAIDHRHILFVEGNRWAMDLEALDDFDDDNLALSIHFYHPIEFTFNFIPHLRYPLQSSAGRFGRETLKKMIGAYSRFARKKQRALFVGEFGVNARQGLYGEDLWLIDILDIFRAHDIHWTYWTFKAVKNACFPDGIYSYIPNDPWISRHGPLSGWETYADRWRTDRAAIIRSWATERFTPNAEVIRILTNAAR